MKYLVAVINLWLATYEAAYATPRVEVQLQVEPATHSFICHYTFTLPATDTATGIALNLDRQFRITDVSSPGATVQRVPRVYYSYFADTLQQVAVRYATGKHHRKRQVSLTYTGTLTPRFFTEQGMVFSGHTNWLPFRPYQEYETVAYTLEVQAPTSYQVVSATAAKRQQPGKWVFRGSTGAIEPTAMVGQQFQQLVSATGPAIRVLKTGANLMPADTALLRKAESILAFYNRTIGQQEPVSRFSIFLPGTNTDAFGLLDNAAVITYTDFDVAGKREDLLILAHEISHKWWGYGRVHDYNDWLNEAFATYSSLLYLRELGDEAGYQAELAKRAATVSDAPAICGFDYQKHPRPVYRRVIYNKGTVVLAALHTRMGTELFIRLLATVAARHVSTTTELLAIVEQIAGAETKAWLLAELNR
ncbi:M1 family aminopeptidase [Hymenobacter pini]|uniref:M1 family aminopeptidase n=1 Tax=Hymenobacter pini TaxID=2880879 RepID=UPI001CF37496|nr:M1 family aminopeptidase [Hymenobacter pini]MCA8832587.1 hypothetical protein [Hymenobacter pini]